MPAVCFYFQVHQPFRLRHYTFFDIGQTHVYEDEEANRAILAKVAEKCYLPANRLLRDLILRMEGRFQSLVLRVRRGASTSSNAISRTSCGVLWTLADTGWR